MSVQGWAGGSADPVKKTAWMYQSRQPGLWISQRSSDQEFLESQFRAGRGNLCRGSEVVAGLLKLLIGEKRLRMKLVVALLVQGRVFVSWIDEYPPKSLTLAMVSPRLEIRTTYARLPSEVDQLMCEC